MIMKKNISLTSEILILIGLGIAFLLVGIFFGPRLQPVWIDEVVLAEPAANLALYDSFTSAAVVIPHSQRSWGYIFIFAFGWVICSKVVGFSSRDFTTNWERDSINIDVNNVRCRHSTKSYTPRMQSLQDYT